MPKGGLGLVWKWRNSTAKMWRARSRDVTVTLGHSQMSVDIKGTAAQIPVVTAESKKPFCHHCLKGLNIYQQGSQRNCPLHPFISELRVSLK